jgi:uncharacterized surface protein with fasciclin (FAS1) repeats
LTVFASRDAAFSEKERSLLLGLMGRGRERQLVNVILDHVIDGKLVIGGTVRRTLGGTSIRMDARRTGRTMNGIHVFCGPIELEGVDLYILGDVIANSLASLILSSS